MRSRQTGSQLIVLLFAWLLLPDFAKAQSSAAFVAPPRSIADITAILDQEKPDAVKRAAREAEAKAEPPAGTQGQALGQFYHRRCQANVAIGRTRDAIADCEKSVSLGGDYANHVSRVQQVLETQYRNIGDYKAAEKVLGEMIANFSNQGKGRLPNLFLRGTVGALQNGDLPRAQNYVNRANSILAESKNWNNVDRFRSSWESNVEQARARLNENRGLHREAEAGYRRARMLSVDAMGKAPSWPSPPPREQFEQQHDYLTAFEGRTKYKQGRLAEAEVDIRRALLSRLKTSGKYNVDTAQVITTFAQLMNEQARWTDAEKLLRMAVEVYETLGYPDDANAMVTARYLLAASLYTQRRYDEANAVYAQVDEGTKNWHETRRNRFRYGWSRIFTAYSTRDHEKGIALAREFVAKEKKRVGDKHYDAAMAQAMLGAGLAFARKDAEAAEQFKTAIPILLNTQRETSDDETVAAAADGRLQNVFEAYIAMLSRSRDTNAASEAFRAAERIRSGSVERALAASSARAAAKDPALAELARQEQDLQKQIGAQLGALNNMLGLAPEEREEKAVKELQADIDKLRTARNTARRDMEKRFPEYADLISPKPSTVDDIRTSLKSDEAFLSFYFGRRSSFVWAVPKQGPVAFSLISMNARAFETKAKTLRESLESNAATISDIPAFDLAAAHDIYNQLLKPVEAGWKPAKRLIVVTNGALGLLPLSLLPTAPAALKGDSEPLFADYRNVPWLAKTHAVTMVPSANALRTLRGLPVASATREKFIGFGDPFFNAKQAGEPQTFQVAAAGEMTTRGVPLLRRAAPQSGVDSAELGLLPRLPDTADELKSIALALETDPVKVLHLGKAANERAVKGRDLSRYRIVAFATHGLVPGELDGLTQPALALSAPSVADVDGDGLLTMEEILGLKLNADWVVLSACNTGAGAGAGAEAASGLGRAFFYAGTRALLVTNWSVHSESARVLVTDLFARQAKDPKLARGDALRQAMLALMDGPGFTDASGKTVFAYAHPMFWAPYTIIGDGGSN
jgi:CHAT domain-containing protein